MWTLPAAGRPWMPVNGSTWPPPSRLIAKDSVFVADRLPYITIGPVWVGSPYATTGNGGWFASGPATPVRGSTPRTVACGFGSFGCVTVYVVAQPPSGTAGMGS